MRISDDLSEIRLFPIHVEAALFGTKKAVPMANINENYNTLRSMPAGNGLESQPFTGMKSQEVPGVHLHFILPEEFTHGSQREEGGGDSLSGLSEPVDGDQDLCIGKRRERTGSYKKKLDLRERLSFHVSDEWIPIFRCRL